MMGRLPTPGDMRVCADGSVYATWFYGDQGADDSWRVTMLWQPGEGFYVFKTERSGSPMVEGKNAGLYLATLIDIGSGKDKAVDLTEWADEELEYNIGATAELLASLPESSVFERAGLESLSKRCLEERDRRRLRTTPAPNGEKP
jgi:hypothetical protein